jgi:oligopeptide/dipeptide ABC transporter ATP-binding protein
MGIPLRAISVNEDLCMIDDNGIKMNDDLVKVNSLVVSFESHGRGGSRRKRFFNAVDGVSFSIGCGEILSLVGESGSGKTTIGKAILGLLPARSGEIIFDGKPVLPEAKIKNIGDVNASWNQSNMREFRMRAQMIFQDPYQSLNPRDRIIDIVAEGPDVTGMITNKEQREQLVVKALESAGLVPASEYLDRYPFELSGGQRQRAAIAGSMILEPEFVVADEPVSMLDASVRTGILKLMVGLREEKGLSYLFITHDLSLAWLISDRIAIMYLGRIVEIGKADIIAESGLHPYTKALSAIMPVPGKKKVNTAILPKGDISDTDANASGCRFRPRCPEAQERCASEEPELVDHGDGHSVACFYAG